jgi:hypothetical protein
MDNCPYCGRGISYDVLNTFDASTEKALFPCPYCEKRMVVFLTWVLGNTLRELFAYSLGVYATSLVVKEFGIIPTGEEWVRL